MIFTGIAPGSRLYCPNTGERVHFLEEELRRVERERDILKNVEHYKPERVTDADLPLQSPLVQLQSRQSLVSADLANISVQINQVERDIRLERDPIDATA